METRTRGRADALASIHQLLDVTGAAVVAGRRWIRCYSEQLHRALFTRSRSTCRRMTSRPEKRGGTAKPHGDVCSRSAAASVLSMVPCPPRLPLLRPSGPRAYEGGAPPSSGRHLGHPATTRVAGQRARAFLRRSVGSGRGVWRVRSQGGGSPSDRLCLWAIRQRRERTCQAPRPRRYFSNRPWGLSLMLMTCAVKIGTGSARCQDPPDAPINAL
jgi:hypothetical protein